MDRIIEDFWDIVDIYKGYKVSKVSILMLMVCVIVCNYWRVVTVWPLTGVIRDKQSQLVTISFINCCYCCIYHIQFARQKMYRCR